MELSWIHQNWFLFSKVILDLICFRLDILYFCCKIKAEYWNEFGFIHWDVNTIEPSVGLSTGHRTRPTCLYWETIPRTAPAPAQLGMLKAGLSVSLLQWPGLFWPGLYRNFSTVECELWLCGSLWFTFCKVATCDPGCRPGPPQPQSRKLVLNEQKSNQIWAGPGRVLNPSDCSVALSPQFSVLSCPGEK